MKRFLAMLAALLVFAALAPVVSLADEEETPMQVCATLPDLGKLAEAVGGKHVEVTSFATGSDDPHHLEAKPSFVTSLAAADALVLNGLELEEGWLPVLTRQCRNAWVQQGGTGYIDASSVITPIEVPTVPVDRTQGDVHAGGNPHYLADPLNGLKVAALLKERFTKLLPKHKQDFEDNYEAFKKKLGEKLVGATLAEKYDITKLARLFEFDKLEKFLKQEGESGLLDGWLKQMQPYHGTKVVSDHKLWGYFATRFGLEVVEQLEPLPGSEPTTAHLKKVIELIKADDVKLILTVAYFNQKHADFVAENTEAKQVRLAHLVGATDGEDDDYLDMVNFNVTSVVEALKEND